MDAIIAMVVAILLYLILSLENGRTLSDLLPLEMYHAPNWFRYIAFISNQNQLKESAERRAALLKSIFTNENPDIEMNHQMKQVEALLKMACKRLGKAEVDLLPILMKLKEDWYEDVESLKAEDVDALGEYMPRRLAKSVLNILNEEEGEFWS
jgi:hypothetical protein